MNNHRVNNKIRWIVVMNKIFQVKNNMRKLQIKDNRSVLIIILVKWIKVIKNIKVLVKIKICNNKLIIKKYKITSI